MSYERRGLTENATVMQMSHRGGMGDGRKGREDERNRSGPSLDREGSVGAAKEAKRDINKKGQNLRVGPRRVQGMGLTLGGQLRKRYAKSWGCSEGARENSSTQKERARL